MRFASTVLAGILVSVSLASTSFGHVMLGIGSFGKPSLVCAEKCLHTFETMMDAN
jgi:hypothetical protein